MTPRASNGSEVMARKRNKNEMRPAYQPSETNACNLGCFTGCCIDPPSSRLKSTKKFVVRVGLQSLTHAHSHGVLTASSPHAHDLSQPRSPAGRATLSSRYH